MVLSRIKASKQHLCECSESGEENLVLLQCLNLFSADVPAVDYPLNIKAGKSLLAVFDDTRELLRPHAIANDPKQACQDLIELLLALLHVLALLESEHDPPVPPELLLHLQASFALFVLDFRNVVPHGCNAQVAKLSNRFNFARPLQREV